MQFNRLLSTIDCNHPNAILLRTVGIERNAYGRAGRKWKKQKASSKNPFHVHCQFTP